MFNQVQGLVDTTLNLMENTFGEHRLLKAAAPGVTCLAVTLGARVALVGVGVLARTIENALDNDGEEKRSFGQNLISSASKNLSVDFTIATVAASAGGLKEFKGDIAQFFKKPKQSWSEYYHGITPKSDFEILVGNGVAYGSEKLNEIHQAAKPQLDEYSKKGRELVEEYGGEFVSKAKQYTGDCVAGVKGYVTPVFAKGLNAGSNALKYFSDTLSEAAKKLDSQN